MLNVWAREERHAPDVKVVVEVETCRYGFCESERNEWEVERIRIRIRIMDVYNDMISDVRIVVILYIICTYPS